jgi:hypothetical protein
MSVLMEAGFLPSTAEYSTAIRHFPGINVHPPWGTKGRFWFEVKIFEDGRLLASERTGVVDEAGTLYLDISAAAEKAAGRPVQGMFVVEYHHAQEIPIEVYAFHIHKATGTYLSCNITPFIGDKLYPTAHSDQMENTLFWPGIIADEDNAPHLLVVNPYDVTMGFQVHLVGPDGVRQRTGILHLRAKRAGEYPILGLFEGQEEALGAANGGYSLCVSSQYKLVSYYMVKSRRHGVMSMMDHLHTFCLA